MSVLKAIDADLEQLAKRDSALATSAMAETARALAKELDNAGNSATSKAMCAKALNDTLERLRELAPPEETKDNLDDLSARRAARIARMPAT